MTGAHCIYIVKAMASSYPRWSGGLFKEEWDVVWAGSREDAVRIVDRLVDQIRNFDFVMNGHPPPDRMMAMTEAMLDARLLEWTLKLFASGATVITVQYSVVELPDDFSSTPLRVHRTEPEHIRARKISNDSVG